MKVAAGYVGSIKAFKRLLAWNLVDLPLRIKLGKAHINRHGYMKRRAGLGKTGV